MKALLCRWWVAGLCVGLLACAVPRAAAQGAFPTVDSAIVVPNPYSVSGRTFGPSSNIFGYERIRFANLPLVCTIKIYTSAGNLVKTLEHKEGDTYPSDVFWNGRNSDNQYIVSDVYIYVVDSPTYGRKIGKFIVIR